MVAGMTDVQVPACAVQPTPFEEVAGQFRAYVRASGCSSNTVRAYGHDLTHLAAFLVEQGLDWRGAGRRTRGFMPGGSATPVRD